jgi:hypothetical protein
MTNLLNKLNGIKDGIINLLTHGKNLEIEVKKSLGS